SPLDATLAWIAAAADDPGRRLARALPDQLDFRTRAAMLRSMQTAALPDTQLGAPLLFGVDGLEMAEELAWRSLHPGAVDRTRSCGRSAICTNWGCIGVRSRGRCGWITGRRRTAYRGRRALQIANCKLQIANCKLTGPSPQRCGIIRWRAPRTTLRTGTGQFA